jgi:hypothetical protein
MAPSDEDEVESIMRHERSGYEEKPHRVQVGDKYGVSRLS